MRAQAFAGIIQSSLTGMDHRMGCPASIRVFFLNSNAPTWASDMNQVFIFFRACIEAQVVRVLAAVVALPVADSVGRRSAF